MSFFSPLKDEKQDEKKKRSVNLKGLCIIQKLLVSLRKQERRRERKNVNVFHLCRRQDGTHGMCLKAKGNELNYHKRNICSYITMHLYTEAS